MPKPMGRSRALQQLSTPEDKDKSPLVTPPCALPQKEGEESEVLNPSDEYYYSRPRLYLGRGGGGGRLGVGGSGRNRPATHTQGCRH